MPQNRIFGYRRISCALTLAGLLLLLLLIGLPAAFEHYYADRFYPGVAVWHVPLGGQRPDEAAAHLEDSLGLDRPLVTLHGPDRSWAVRPADLGLRLLPAATLDAPYRLGRGFPWPQNLRAHLRLLVQGADFPPVFLYDERATRLYLETLAEQIAIPAADAAFTIEGTTPIARPAQTGRALDVDASLEAVAAALRRVAPTDVALVVHPVTPTITDAAPARAEAEAILAGPLTLTLADPREGDPGPWVFQPEQLAAMITVQAVDGVLHARLDESLVREYLAELAPQIAVEPVDARFHFDETSGQLTPISPSADGRALDIAASAARIVQEAAQGQRYIPLVVQTVPPRYPDTATAAELGIVTLVAEGDSYFIGSPSGRDHNIRVATPKFDGVIVGPGEVFSFNHYLGEVSAEAGYDESYIIAGEQLAIEVGGGICQVSTTAFRAAFWGGYPIVEHWYHHHRVGYYELGGAGVGMDATVYSPLLDFKFRNDRPTPLLIETEIEEATHRLVFRFYSTDDGRRVEKEGPVITDETAPGPPLYELDPDLPPGTVVRWQSARNGITATIRRRVYDADGNLLYDDLFVSEYAPRRAIYHYGPGYQPPPTEEEESNG